MLAIAVSIFCVFAAGILVLSTGGTIAGTIARFSPINLGLVCALLTGGTLLASLRLKLIARDMGYRLSFRDSVAALCAGQVAGSIFFQFAGQLIGRAALLSRRDMVPDATVLLTAYERLLAVFVSLTLAGAGALYLFGQVTFDFAHGGAPLLKLGLGLIVATTGSAALSWWRTAKPLVGRSVTLRFIAPAARNLIISLAIQLLTVAAYVVAALMFAPTAPIIDVVAASPIVMLAASLPISFGGWGVREISAVVALGSIGLKPSAAFMVGVSIGLTSLAIVFGLALLTARAWNLRVEKLRTEQSADYGAALDWIIPLAAATAIFFQIYVPVREEMVNVNLADPLAILCGSLMLVRMRVLWSRPVIGAFVLFTFVIFAAWLRGVLTFGYTDWATTKMLGWLVLLSYAATGAFLAAKRDGLRMLLLAFVGAALGICVLELVLLVASETGLSFASAMLQWPISGFSQNRNAFAFILLMALAAALVSQPKFFWGGESFWRRSSLRARAPATEQHWCCSRRRL